MKPLNEMLKPELVKHATKLEKHLEERGQNNQSLIKKLQQVEEENAVYIKDLRAALAQATSEAERTEKLEADLSTTKAMIKGVMKSWN